MCRINWAGVTTFLGKPFGLDVWAPNINIGRDPRWGRLQETPGEDPYLSGQYAIHFIRGLEGTVNMTTQYLKLVSTVKHFDAYSLENWEGMDRFHFNAVVSTQDLNQTYLPAFQNAVIQGGVHGLMCSYNEVNGVPSCGDPFLLNDTLRNAWGFDGYVVSDCDAIEVMWIDHNYTHSGPQSVAVGLQAGTDLDCGGTYSLYASQAVSSGQLNESTIDQALTRLFSLQMKLGLFDPVEGQVWMPSCGVGLIALLMFMYVSSGE